MKNNCLKLLRIFLIIATVLISACSSDKEQNNEIEENEISNPVDSETPETSVEDEITKLGKAEFSKFGELSYDLEKTSGWGEVEVFNNQNILSENYDFSAYFLWKYYVDDWIVVCIVAERMIGMSDSDIDFWLVTFDKEFNKADELLFYKFHLDVHLEREDADPLIEFVNGTFMTNAGRFKINEKGKFVKEIGEIKTVALSEFNDLFNKTNLPFILDTDLFDKKDKFKTLRAGHVKTLFNGENDFAGMYSNAGTFIMIDSLKQTGLYDEFVNSDNAGEIEESEACAFYKINLDDENVAYIWGIHDATQETGGPNSRGTTYYISFASNNKVNVSYLLAEFSAGGDAPMWQEKKVKASFDNNKILTIHYEEVLGDDDAEEEYITEKEYIYVLHEGKLVFNKVNVIQGEE